jgi:hypothetical protein
MSANNTDPVQGFIADVRVTRNVLVYDTERERAKALAQMQAEQARHEREMQELREQSLKELERGYIRLIQLILFGAAALVGVVLIVSLV